MTTSELLKRYNEAFGNIMDETNCQRFRYSEAHRAITLAEVMQDNHRLVLAAEIIDHLGRNAKFEDGK